VSAVLAAILMVGLCVPAETRTEPTTTKKAASYLVGLQLYTVRDECAKDLPGVLKAVAKMGFTGVEFAGYWGYSAQDLRRMLDEDHLVCYGSHIQVSDLMPDKFDQTVAFNKTLGNKLVTVASIPGNMRNSKEAIVKTGKLFNELAKKLQHEGIMLAYHNHMDEFKPVDGEMPWYTFFNNTDNNVKIQFDTGNAMQAGQQAAPYLLKYPKRVMSVHFKDHSDTNPNALLGEGDEDWKTTVDILKHKVHPRWFIIEQESYPFPSLVCAEKCLRTFEKMMSEN